VKDSNGQVVKSKLDEKRLKEIAETTAVLYSPGRWTADDETAFDDGLAKMQTGEIDDRMSRRRSSVINGRWRGAAGFRAAFFFANETGAGPAVAPVPPRRALATAAAVLLFAGRSFAAAPGWMLTGTTTTRKPINNLRRP